MKILVVEDDKSNQMLIKHELRDERAWAVITASDGKEAMDIFNAIWPDVVVLDLRLPFIPGDELLKMMKKARPSTVVIILTGYDKFDGVEMADAFIVKTKDCGDNLKAFIKRSFPPSEI